MEFFVNEDDARQALPRLRSAAEALGASPELADVDRYRPGRRADLAAYMQDHGVEFFSVREVVEPNDPDKAREAGFEELVPPLHLWPWAMLVLKIGDRIREHVGQPVVLRNLYRPMSYNRLVAKSGIRSDHPNAAAGDFDFPTVDERRDAEQLVRSLSSGHPELEMSLGMGARSLHVGILSPEGHRHWFYDSYSDRRVPLGAEDSTGDEGEPDADDGGGGATPEDPGRGGPAPAAEEDLGVLDEELRLQVIQHTAVHESGGDFSAMNRDGEFEGRFNRPGEPHPAFQTFHIGLSYGIIQFTQDSGSLGDLLIAMRERDPAAFEEIFGEQADELIVVTTADGPSSQRQPPRGPRVQPVDGADLWEEPWTTRFRRAGEHPPFQDAQLDLAARAYLDPMLPFCHWLALDTDRALAIVFDRAVQQGRGGAKRWIMSVIGPVVDDEMRSGVLDRYGFGDVEEFQQAIPGLRVDGEWGPNTHAALCWFERQRSDEDPFVMHVPSRNEMLDMLVLAARDRRWGHRVQRLRDSDAFSDRVLELAG